MGILIKRNTTKGIGQQQITEQKNKTSRWSAKGLAVIYANRKMYDKILLTHKKKQDTK
jgi:hypothetical protein